MMSRTLHHETGKKVRYKQAATVAASSNRRHSSASSETTTRHSSKVLSLPIVRSAPATTTKSRKERVNYWSDLDDRDHCYITKEKNCHTRKGSDYSTRRESDFHRRRESEYYSYQVAGTRRIKLDSTSSYLSTSGATSNIDEMDIATKEDVERLYNSGQREQEAAKMEKMMLIKRLLANFDLQKTYDHYRNLYRQVFAINPAAFSFDCAMPATRARERLVKMTGSDNVNLIDSNYMAMLHEKFWQEYEDELDHQEKLRMETEKNRVRKLMVQGYITPEQLHQEDKVTYKEQTNKKNRSSNTKKNATTNGKNIVSTAKTNGTVDINSSTKENDETEVSKSVHYQSDHVTENNEESTQRVSDEVSSEEKETLKQSLSNGSEQNTISNHNEEETKELAANSSQPPVKYTPKYMEPRLIELYNQESVQALYDKAEQLIPPLSTLMHKSSSKKRVTLG